jgi:hypothetical protein
MLGILRRFPDGGDNIAYVILTDVFIDDLCIEFREWVAPQRSNTLDEAVSLGMR